MWNYARAHVGAYIFVEETERLSMVQLDGIIKELSIIKELRITQNMFKGDVYTNDDGSCQIPVHLVHTVQWVRLVTISDLKGCLSQQIIKPSHSGRVL